MLKKLLLAAQLIVRLITASLVLGIFAESSSEIAVQTSSELSCEQCVNGSSQSSSPARANSNRRQGQAGYSSGDYRQIPRGRRR